jgi:hypothetical protein
MKFAVRITLLFAVLLIAGCVTAPPRIAPERESISRIAKLEVLPMRIAQPDLVILNNPGASFGLIGATIAEVNRTGKRDTMREFLTQANFNLDAVFREQMLKSFSERNITLILPEPIMGGGKVKREDYGLRKSYQGITTQADALLDINFGFVGYAAAGAGKKAPYRPTVVMAVRLLSADGKVVLFSDYFVHNNAFGDKKAIIVQPDELHVYPDFDDLKAAGTAIAPGLEAAIQRSIEAVVRTL